MIFAKNAITKEQRVVRVRFAVEAAGRTTQSSESQYSQLTNASAGLKSGL